MILILPYTYRAFLHSASVMIKSNNAEPVVFKSCWRYINRSDLSTFETLYPMHFKESAKIFSRMFVIIYMIYKLYFDNFLWLIDLYSSEIQIWPHKLEYIIFKLTSPNWNWLEINLRNWHYSLLEYKFFWKNKQMILGEW